LNRDPVNLSKKLSYQFFRIELLETALTHRSAGSPNNERLEYLGDSVLNFIIADALYNRFVKASEGELSRLRANLVNGDTLAGIARGMHLGDFLRLGPGELKSGGYRRDSILAGATEAVIGAVYLDGGFDSCRQLVTRIFHDILDNISLDTVIKDPKTRLQEYLQSKKLQLPVYNILSTSGRDHDQIFKVGCVIEGRSTPFIGEGGSRRKAEQDAAEKALKLIIQEDKNQ
jgi:ribonuclease-3